MRTFTAVAATALLVATVIAAAPAHAEPPFIEGYVWGNQPANPDYLAATGYEYNSAGGPIQITRNGVGSYHVRFQGMAGAGGVAHASAYGANASHVCTVNAYGPRMADEVVHVRCFDTAGAPADSQFVANVTNRQPAGGHLAYLWSDNAVPPAGGYVPPAQWSHDSTGGVIHVNRVAVGHYKVKLGAFVADLGSGAWADGYLRATAFGSTPAHCQVLQTKPYINVNCYGMDGFAIDTRFTLTYARDAGMLGGPVPHASATMRLLAGGPVLDGWSNTAGGTPTFQELAMGSYLVTFPGAGVADGHAIATMMGTPPMFCNVVAWWQWGGSLNIWFKCWDGNVGTPTPAIGFNVAFMR